MKPNAISHTPARQAFPIISIPPLFRRKTHEEIEQAMRTGGFSSLRFERAKRYAAWAITGGAILVITIMMTANLILPAHSPRKSGREFVRTFLHLSHPGGTLLHSAKQKHFGKSDSQGKALGTRSVTVLEKQPDESGKLCAVIEPQSLSEPLKGE